jgi:hypothetical protein
MRALDRRQPTPASRAALGLLALVISAVLAIGIMALPPKVLAGPPPASCPPPYSSQPCLVLTPTQGKAAAAFKAEYWFIPDGACDTTGYKTVQFSWDGKPVATVSIDPVECYASYRFPKATSSVVTAHRVTAVACPAPSGVGCDDANAAITGTYTVLPTPTLKLSPAKGLATAPFTATYRSGERTCSSAAQFYWGSAPVGAPVPLDATCTAVMHFASAPSHGVGSHTVKAQICARTSCTLSASAKFTVLPPPTPSPTPTSTPTPTPTPTPSPTPSPTPEMTPSPTPSQQPSEEVLQATSPPRGSPTPLPAAVVVPSGPPDSPNSYVPAIVSYIGGPDRGNVDPAVVATNVLLTLLVLFLFGLTAEVFNSTMDANRDEVHGWWTRLFRGPLALLAALNVSGASLGHLSGSGRIGSTARVLLILSLLGIIYGFLSPDFGWNPQSLILIVSLIVGLGFLTFFSEGSATRLATSRYRADASIKLYGTAIVVAILAVVVSRLVDFSPGLVYGFIASAVIVAPVALAKRDDATLVLVPAFGVLIVSLLAWLLLGPVRAAAAGGEPLPALAESILAMIVIGGLEGLFITMIPLTFLDGATVKNWSRLGWALVFGVVTFLWWQLLLNQDASYLGAFEQTNVRVVLATLGVFMLTTGGLWSYFRFRPAATEAEA